MSDDKNVNSYESQFDIESQEIDNQYLRLFINDFVKKFRHFNQDVFSISISGLKKFVHDDDKYLTSLINHLKINNLEIDICGNSDNINNLEITANNITEDKSYCFSFQIQSVPNIIELSSKTDISAVGIIIMKIIAQLISRLKILYKAVVLDLDDTLWKGILSEDGVSKIKETMQSESGIPFIDFMKFIRTLGNELGLFIAICSRNDSNLIESSLEQFDETNFPLKNQIDFIIANNNDKSENIKLIAEQLSILPSSIIFIDDNQIVRDEVKNKLSDVFVPEWLYHNELTTQLIVGCFFERFELSVNSKNRRKQYRIINSLRARNSLPNLSVKVISDNEHLEATRLYTKSNQFKFSQFDNNFDTNSKSLYFELIRENGDNLGICSAITYKIQENSLIVVNWAISCRYFEIGLEEFVLTYIHNISKSFNIVFNYFKTDYNDKITELMGKYPFKNDENNFNKLVELSFTSEVAQKLNSNTNLKLL